MILRPCAVLLAVTSALLSIGTVCVFAVDPSANSPAVSQLQCEGAIPAAEVKADAVIFRHEAKLAETLTGFYARLTNCVGPRHEPTVVGLRLGNELTSEQIAIPVYGEPLNMYTRSEGGHVFPPLDVGQEYRIALATPIPMKPGDTVAVEVISSEPLSGGLTAGLQFAGSWPLLEMREPFRVTKDAGPVCRVAWSPREVVCTGTQQKLDPLCAPQNNSGVVTDANGSLYEFSAFYSVDEQYGGGRNGSFARLFGFRRQPADAAWQPLGLVADPVPMGLTYCGDPFAFRDLQGRPCLVYTVCDGTNGFADWKKIGAQMIRSTTDSFAGPWERPHGIFENLPYTEVGRVNCLRIYPRAKTKDYVVVWLHGDVDIRYAAAILPDLNMTLTQEQIKAAPTLTRNQEEGGGGFVRGDKGYLSTWQIPCINDTTSIQRLYEFDLYDPLNPEKWRVVPGSWGWNDGTSPIEDGGATADAWSLSYQAESDMLRASCVVWSVSGQKNSTLACSVPWNQRISNTFQYGCPKAFIREVAPVVEYAVNDTCSLSATITATGAESAIYVCLAPSQRPVFQCGIGLEVTPKGSRLAAYSDKGEPWELTPYVGKPFAPAAPYRVRLERSGYTITGWVNDQQIGPITVTDPVERSHLDEPQRFKFYGWQGCLYSIQDAVLIDGYGK